MFDTAATPIWNLVGVGFTLLGISTAVMAIQVWRRIRSVSGTERVRRALARREFASQLTLGFVGICLGISLVTGGSVHDAVLAVMAVLLLFWAFITCVLPRARE